MRRPLQLWRQVYTLELPKMTASVPYYIGVYLREDTIDADGDNPTANLRALALA